MLRRSDIAPTMESNEGWPGCSDEARRELSGDSRECADSRTRPSAGDAAKMSEVGYTACVFSSPTAELVALELETKVCDEEVSLN